ncbi:hypothetical protein PQ462_12600 [Flavobacterium sp. KACC 22758]|uniref:hypothetical protein n=1 Tax=Flavobacterium sp. KACC 22758 TaxID=3025667 RepID=UPI002366E91C|nr:hypothetical protein [Flavobacterium sp. KACC 22758]WDF57556.1 hypothetical protein PQ462_12600 [Flavobacterium sp. KACC 22758]
MLYYHFSYDTIDCKKHFSGNYDEAKRYLLCTLLSIPNKYLKSMGALCESTLILELSEADFDSDRFYQYFKTNISPYFYYVVSEISVVNNQLEFEVNSNKTLRDNFKNSLQNIVCDNLLQGIKAEY